MFRITGRGDIKHTDITVENPDGEYIKVPYKKCFVHLGLDSCYADVDGVKGVLSDIDIKGVYTIQGDGTFRGTKVFIYDEMLRGVQELSFSIEEGKDPLIFVGAVLLPNVFDLDGDKVQIT